MIGGRCRVPQPVCRVPGQIVVNGDCVCPKGQQVIGGRCRVPQRQCSVPGQVVDQNGRCVCPKGTQVIDGACRKPQPRPTCRIPGQIVVNGDCVCPKGQQVINGACRVPKRPNPVQEILPRPRLPQIQ